ncbi:MAG: 4Fe-4S dicluster domain-containing protein [Ignavibacteriales bacterium]|nr:4Fe-4S dicluster domain-containing protein [Ignavibacteriales bacterium]
MFKQETEQQILSEELPDLQRCIQCGFCLPTCPTYSITGKERSSPRGRIQMLKGVAYGMLEMNQAIADEMFFCLGCLACETACPAGVNYHSILETGRSVVHKKEKEKLFSFERFLLNAIFLSPRRIKFAAKLLRLFQRSGLSEALQRSGIVSLFSEKMSELLSLSPTIAEKFSDEQIGEVAVSSQKSEVRKQETTIRVGLPLGCITNVAFPEINIATKKLLESYGCEVVIPKEANCCGALHGHNGDLQNAKQLAKNTIDSFENGNCNYIISTAAGCGAFMKHYGKIHSGLKGLNGLLEDDVEYAEKARRFSERVYDISEFIANIEMQVDEFIKRKSKIKNLKSKITYHDACHLSHGQKITKEPREILRSLDGIEITELQESTWCCGSAGIYNVTHYDDSVQMLERKMENIRKTNAEIVLTGNVGCIQQLRYGAKKFNVNVEVMHIVEFIDKYYL